MFDIIENYLQIITLQGVFHNGNTTNIQTCKPSPLNTGHNKRKVHLHPLMANHKE